MLVSRFQKVRQRKEYSTNCSSSRGKYGKGLDIFLILQSSKTHGLGLLGISYKRTRPVFYISGGREMNELMQSYISLAFQSSIILFRSLFYCRSCSGRSIYIFSTPTWIDFSFSSLSLTILTSIKSLPFFGLIPIIIGS